MAKEFKLTSIKLKQYEDELNYLKTVRESEVAEQIKEARSFGDLSENSEYDEAKNEQAKLYGRIQEIENILSHAVIIAETEDAVGKIGLGCTIKVRDLDPDLDEDERELVITIVGSPEADPELGKISDESPFGRALVGHVAGETISYEVEINQVMTGPFCYEVLSVEK